MALGTTVLGTGACIVLNFVLVLMLGFGIAGSAFSTIIGQGVGMIPVLWFFMFSKKAPFKLHAKNLPVSPKAAAEIMALGVPSFIMQCGNAVVTLVLNHVINLYAATDPIGVTDAFATISIVWKVMGLAYTVVIGITAGAQPILGFNVGACQWTRVKKTLKWACIDAAALATAAWAFFELWPSLVLSIFSIGDDLMPFACMTMRIFAIWLPFVGYQMMGSSHFQSTGQPLKATVLELTRQILFLIPLYLLFPPVAMQLLGVSGLTGVVLCVPLADALATILTTFFVVREVRRLNKLIKG